MARPLTARDKLIAVGMGWFLFGGLSAYAVVAIHPAFLIATLLIMLGLGIYIFMIRCPKCSTPLIQRTMKVRFARIVYYSIPDDDVCSKCGERVI